MIEQTNYWPPILVVRSKKGRGLALEREPLESEYVEAYRFIVFVIYIYKCEQISK